MAPLASNLSGTPIEPSSRRAARCVAVWFAWIISQEGSDGGRTPAVQHWSCSLVRKCDLTANHGPEWLRGERSVWEMRREKRSRLCLPAQRNCSLLRPKTSSADS